ncbi:glycosyl hydrolase family 61-domain-containing protein [Mycena crocata]|nr:glycosyl hydrolase family 61-domain-containing protein [Mycena crocata]
MQYFLLAAVIVASTGFVVGHGQVYQVISGSTKNMGPNINYSKAKINSMTATRMMYTSGGDAFVLPSGFNDNDKMSCEGSAKSPAPKTISVAAGDDIDVYWEGATAELQGKPGTGSLPYKPWVHAIGFVLDYITSCDDDCTKFDATGAGWTKIAHAGLDMSQSISDELRNTMKNKPEEYFPRSGPGLWAMAKLIQDGSMWKIKIPSSLKSGQYIIRHELSAVQIPRSTKNPKSGPQNYIACIQLDVTGGGDATLPAGTQAKDLYKPDGELAKINVYSGSFDPSNVTIPGPPIWDAVLSSSGNNSNSGDEDKEGATTDTSTATTTDTGSPTTTDTSAITTDTSAITTDTSISATNASPTSTKACRKRRRGVMKRAKRSHNPSLRRTHPNHLA